MKTAKQQNDGNGMAGVLGYAPTARSGRQSLLGVVSVVCGTASLVLLGVLVLAKVLLPEGYVWWPMHPGGDPRYLRYWMIEMIAMLGLFVVGMLTGVLGLMQRKYGRKAAIVGLAMSLLWIAAFGRLV